jgi:hypothetical protein
MKLIIPVLNPKFHAIHFAKVGDVVRVTYISQVDLQDKLICICDSTLPIESQVRLAYGNLANCVTTTQLKQILTFLSSF